MNMRKLRKQTSLERADPDSREQDLDSAEWQEARRRAVDIGAFVGEGSVPQASVNALAERWAVSRATVWRYIRRYRREGSLRGLLKRTRGPVVGVMRLSSVVETTIADAARSWWRNTENATVAEIFPTVLEACKARAIPAPSRATVARRLALLRQDPANFTHEVRKKLQERTRLVKSSYVVTQPLAVIQIDHTIADTFVVDPQTRRCIGRPTLTVAIDIATRSVMGFCLSLEAPSALLVALCLEHAVFPKTDWLKRIGVDAEWPQHGQMRALHSDNGREFRSAAFRRGCDLNGIETLYRPPATLRFGGHIERLIGTLMRRVRLLPGNSYSDLLKARPSRAEARATLTLADLQGFLVEDIARYHARRHRTLGCSPRSAWNHAWDRAGSVPKLPADQDRFRTEFLPVRRRVIGREGIELFNLQYSNPALASEVALGVQRVIRFDPRDLSRVYLERKAQSPLMVPLRDARFPVLSWWEWKAIQQTDRALANSRDADALRQALRPHALVAKHAPKNLQARRRAARIAAWREVQAIAALPTRDLGMEPTMISNSGVSPLTWEILE